MTFPLITDKGKNKEVSDKELLLCTVLNAISELSLCLSMQTNTPDPWLHGTEMNGTATNMMHGPSHGTVVPL